MGRVLVLAILAIAPVAIAGRPLVVLQIRGVLTMQLDGPRRLRATR